MDSEAFLAGEHVTRAVLLCRGRDIGEIVARLALGMREGEQCFTGRDLRQHIALHRVACAAPQEAAAEHDRREIRLERERTAESLHHDHGLDRTAADAAVLLGEGERGEAEIDVLPPHVAAPAVGLRHVFLARLEFVALRAQPLDRVFQQPLLFGKFEVHSYVRTSHVASCRPSEARAGIHNHGLATQEPVVVTGFRRSPLRGARRKDEVYNPNIAFAMIFFWISFEPP